MTINKKSENGTLTLVLEGSLDTSTSLVFQETLIPAFDEAQDIVLDFTALEYMSSAGIRVLMIGQDTADEKGVGMTITGVSDEVMEIFEMTGLADEFTIE